MCACLQSTGTRGPLDIAYLYKHYEDRNVRASDGQGVFIIAYEAAALYKLPPGQYTAVLFLNEPDTQLSYVFSVGYLRQSTVMVRGYNTFNDAISLAK